MHPPQPFPPRPLFSPNPPSTFLPPSTLSQGPLPPLPPSLPHQPHPNSTPRHTSTSPLLSPPLPTASSSPAPGSVSSLSTTAVIIHSFFTRMFPNRGAPFDGCCCCYRLVGAACVGVAMGSSFIWQYVSISAPAPAPAVSSTRLGKAGPVYVHCCIVARR